MVVSDQIEAGRAGVGLHLIDRPGAGDHAADGRVPQAPAKGPLGHGHRLGHLGPAKLLDQLQLALDLGGVVT
jgi:hypothetical protein